MRFQETAVNRIAIIGLSVRLPNVCTVAEYWNAISSGKELLTREVVTENGAHVVRLTGQLPHLNEFDGAFFKFTPKEARLTDPQQRLMMELGWEAVEDGGYDVGSCARKIGVFTSISHSRYLEKILASREFEDDPSIYDIAIHGCLPEHASTRLAYKLNLQGPAMSVSSACSSSLVAVSQAADSLVLRRCDMAIAGGICSGDGPDEYIAVDGGILSPDGKCRPFDAAANGTVPGNGGGLVLLKRYEDAVADHDRIYCVIRGTEVNNDGKRKLGYSAPSPTGQSEAIMDLLQRAQTSPESIGYVEAHGTGTNLGDPIELAALARAFGAASSSPGFCGVGSVKGSIGHTDSAAGVMGLIKAALSIHFDFIPPSVNFSTPNPALDIAESPFFFTERGRSWDTLRFNHALVASLGIGGTNAYALLEKYDGKALSTVTAARANVIPLSAKSVPALEQLGLRMEMRILDARDHDDVANVAFTAQVGRARFNHRSHLVVTPSKTNPEHPPYIRITTGTPYSQKAHVCFTFPGQGGAFRGLFGSILRFEPRLLEHTMSCCELFKVEASIDILPQILESAPQEECLDTLHAQAALFTTGFALASYLIELGIIPDYLIGHSVGELAALAVSGAMSLRQAVKVVSRRGRIFRASPPGTMLAAHLAARDLGPLYQGTWLAAINGPRSIVLSGNPSAIENVERLLGDRGVATHRLATGHAFHSGLMKDAAEEFAEAAESFGSYAEPRIPVASTVTGGWLTERILNHSDYWGAGVKKTVQFNAAVEKVLAENLSPVLLLELGPGATLTNLVRSIALAQDNPLLSAFPAVGANPTDAHSQFTSCLGHAWNAGVEILWARQYQPGERQKTSIPTYVFDRIPVTNPPPMHQKLTAPTETLEVLQGNVKNNQQAADGVRDCFRQVLGMPVVDDQATVFELGGDSLTCISLAQVLSNRFGPALTLASILVDPSVKGVLALVEPHSKTNGPIALPSPAVSEQLASLPLDIQPASGSPAPFLLSGAHVLLTGATGFVGLHLLAELLKASTAHVYCLIRGTSEPLARLVAAMQRFELWDSAYLSKVSVLVGDITAPQLGLTAEALVQLEESVDHIFHCAAWVNHIFPSSTLWRANVDSVTEILRLGSRRRNMKIHFVSTAAVWEAEMDQKPRAVYREDEALTIFPDEFRGYSRSKAAGETLVLEAARRGLAVAIYRPGNLAGRGEHGICNWGDGIWCFLKACVILRAVPRFAWGDRPITAYMGDVGDTAATLVALASRPTNRLVFHLVPKSAVDLRQAFDSLRRAGHEFDRVDAAEWQQRLHAVDHAQDDFAEWGWIATALADGWDNDEQEFDDKNVRESLGEDFRMRSPGSKEFDTYIRKFQSDSFFPSQKTRPNSSSSLG